MRTSTAEIQIRDPFVVPVREERSYYLYGTTDKNPWNGPGCGFDCYCSADLEKWDGPFLHKTADGQLLMLWSSIGACGYTMGIACSASGSVEGPWAQNPEPIVADDGGHGMIFRSFDGRLLMAFHRPNRTPNERACFVPVEEVEGKLRAL